MSVTVPAVHEDRHVRRHPDCLDVIEKLEGEGVASATLTLYNPPRRAPRPCSLRWPAPTPQTKETAMSNAQQNPEREAALVFRPRAGEPHVREVEGSPGMIQHGWIGMISMPTPAVDNAIRALADDAGEPDDHPRGWRNLLKLALDLVRLAEAHGLSAHYLCGEGFQLRSLAAAGMDLGWLSLEGGQLDFVLEVGERLALTVGGNKTESTGLFGAITLRVPEEPDRFWAPTPADCAFARAALRVMADPAYQVSELRLPPGSPFVN